MHVILLFHLSYFFDGWYFLKFIKFLSKCLRQFILMWLFQCFTKKPISFFLFFLVLKSYSSTLTLKVEAFKDTLLLSSFVFYFFFALASFASSLFKSCSCSVSLPNSIVISKVFKSCDCFMHVTFRYHSLRMDFNTLLAKSLLDKFFPRLFNLLIKLIKHICMDFTISPFHTE